MRVRQQPRLQLQVILNQINNDVTAYLNKVKFSIIDGKNEILLGRCIERFKKHYGYVKDEKNNRFIFVYNEGNRDHYLTASRILTMILLKEKILNETKNANACNDMDGLKNAIDRIREAILSTLEKNMSLNNEYRKTHTSFLQNRLQGMSFFSSWANATTYKSRAMTQLEFALENLQNFENKNLYEEREEVSLYRRK